MVGRLTIAMALASGLAAAEARASCALWPGGEDGGCLTAAPVTSRCEQKVGGDLGKLATGHVKCQRLVADAIFKTGTASASAEAACKTKAASALAGADTTACACVDPAGLVTLWEGQLDSGIALVYCDQSGATIASRAPGSTDAGWVTPIQAALKCEDQLAKATGKLLKALLKCHQATAKAAVKGSAADDETCEAAARATFTTKAAGLKGCQGCESVTGLLALADTLVDAGNAAVYCASPSGAFVAPR
ncbi:MAG TPA: hypothetical protein VKW76_04110 [Candidatus Binatia bacterium]|nr:hypothetical protein [Candidatus Binatia bacterium]